MKRNKQPGENISLKTKKNEAPEVMDWINSQSNLMDSIRYLIENEVRQFGVRNLQQLIPADRSGLAAGAAIASLETAAAAQPVPQAGSGSPAETASPAAAAPQTESWPQTEAVQSEAGLQTAGSEADAASGTEDAVEGAPQPGPEEPAEARKPLPEDDIDEEDIESWI